jgi:dinuclear metal center YbgI/SA1388 family protein
MADRDTIIDHCNDLLKLHSYPDYGPMGVQFVGQENVTKIACAVSVSTSVIKAAAEEGAQMLIVHHGLFWNNEKRIMDKRHESRLEALDNNKITLLSYHLALDAHPTFGNNFLAAKKLGVIDPQPFADLGFGGALELPTDVYALKRSVFDEFDSAATLFQYGKRDVARVAVITGGAAHYVTQAHEEGYDLFFTGEADEPSMYLACDLGMNFMAAGHDKTERDGVKALTQHIADTFQVETKFLKVDNPV